MTAIAGLVGHPPTDAREVACRKSLEALSLYGSRRSTYATADAAFGVNLHELLPEDRFDRQPYANDRFFLVADVRLDNRSDLIAALGVGSASAAVYSDAELLFRAWCRWEDRCVDRIVGDYAFAVHDNQRNSLYLARDPIGQRPLFYARIGEAIFFASMPSGIFPHGKVEHDSIAIAQRLAARETDSRRSYFAGIVPVLSGETVIISGDRIESKRWLPRVGGLEARATEQLTEEMRAILDEALGARLRRIEGPVATHLSSGYDSSAVTATASMQADKSDIVAFTSAPAPGLPTAAVWQRNVDESPIAARTAQYLGIRHEIVRTPQPLLDSLRDHTRHFQEPVRNVLNMGWYAEIERRAADLGARVLLTGDLGNLTLSAGGLRDLAEWIRRGALSTWWREAAAAAGREDVKWRGILMASFGLYMPKWLQDQLLRIYVGQPRWSSACFVRPDVYRELPDEVPERSRRPAAERLETMRGYDAGMFRKGSLAKHGIDERDPTADRRLTEFSLTLPPEQLIHSGVYKPLARAVLADRLPSFVLDLPVRGYQGADWVSRIDPKRALEVVEEIAPNTTVQSVIDLPRLRSAILRWPDGYSGASAVESFGRHVTNALAMGVFVIESEDQARLGR
jgi:asparagine synthase (glutamine-hydrolysing)